MKSFPFLLLLGCGLLCLTTGCVIDDDISENVDNVLTFDGRTFNITFGQLDDLGSAPGIDLSGYDVYLLANGLTLDSDDQFADAGDFIYVALISADPNTLAPGTYEYNRNPADFTAMDVEIVQNINVPAQNGGVTTSLTGGSVTVSRDGEDFILDFNFTASGGRALTGRYVGTLEPT